MSETEFAAQLQMVREAWEWSRRLARKRMITARPRSVVFAEANFVAQAVLDAIERLHVLATTDEQQQTVADVDGWYGRVVKDEVASRQGAQ